jgi:hypothetical protein
MASRPSRSAVWIASRTPGEARSAIDWPFCRSVAPARPGWRGLPRAGRAAASGRGSGPAGRHPRDQDLAPVAVGRCPTPTSAESERPDHRFVSLRIP